MADQQTNLHPKNNTTVDLKPNIVTENIPDKAVTMEKLDQSLQDTISTHSLQIAVNGSNITKNTADITKNTADIAKNTADIIKNTEDITKNKSNVDSILDIIDIVNNKINVDTLKNSIQGDDDVIVEADNDENNENWLGIHLSPEFQSKIAKNTADIAKNKADITKNTTDIAKNTADIAKNTEKITENEADITDNTLIISSLETKTKNLETRTKNLEDTKVIVNTGTFDPTSDNPASQKSIAGAMEKKPTLMSNIVDSHGNKRFVEGNITMVPRQGFTNTYGKWSLSGTHLMIVIAFDLDSGVATPVNGILAQFSLPEFIYSNIKNLWNDVASIIDVNVREKALWYKSKILDNIQLHKDDNQRCSIRTSGTTITTTALSACRIQFDLLIDSD